MFKVILTLIFLAVPAAAQIMSGSIAGAVVDTTAANIPPVFFPGP